MKLQDLHKHLYTYDDHTLSFIAVNGHTYKGDPSVKPSAIVCFSFGKTMSPDSYNARLAQTIIDARDYYGRSIPVIAQREVYELYVEAHGDSNVYGVCRKLQKNTIVGTDVRTKDAFTEVKHVAIENEIDMRTILYIAHPAHLFRVMAMGKKVIVRGNPLDGKPFVDTSPSYNPNDGQRFVRSPKVFAYREVLARTHHKIMRWV